MHTVNSLPPTAETNTAASSNYTPIFKNQVYYVSVRLIAVSFKYLHHRFLFDLSNHEGNVLSSSIVQSGSPFNSHALSILSNCVWYVKASMTNASGLYLFLM